jgi:hypothetical protein
MQAKADEGRTEAMDRVRKVRRGEFALVWPDQFNEQFPTAIVANFVDVAARDLAANLSPLPSLACSAGQMRTDGRQAAGGEEEPDRVGLLAPVEAADADEVRRRPVPDVRLPAVLGGGRLREQGPADPRRGPDRRLLRAGPLAEDEAVRPGVASAASPSSRPCSPSTRTASYNDQYGRGTTTPDTEVVRYIDDTNVVIYLPERGNVVVASYEHGMTSARSTSRCDRASSRTRAASSTTSCGCSSRTR